MMATLLIVKLQEPYWSAWQKYGWEKGVEGFGIAAKLLNDAKEQGVSDVRVEYKNKSYRTKMFTLVDYYRENRNIYMAKGEKIVVFPRTLFTEDFNGNR